MMLISVVCLFALSLTAAPIGPDTSLDTVPVMIHSFYGKHDSVPWPRSQADLEILAKYRQVVIEKFEGPCWLECYQHNNCSSSCGTEDYIVGTAQGIKKINPNVSITFYLNSVMSFPMYHYDALLYKNVSLLLHDKTGKIGKLQNDAGMKNLSVPDFGQEGARQLHLAEIKKYMDTGAIDGIFSDKAVKSASKDQLCNHDCIDLTDDVATAWSNGHQQLMYDVQELLGEGVNMVKGGCDWYQGNRTSIYTENLSPNQDSIDKILAFQKAGHRFVYAYAGKNCEEEVIATFLMVVEEGTFINCYKWDPMFEKALGAPVGPAKKSGNVYTRSFASGTTATVDVKKNTGSITWAS